MFTKLKIIIPYFISTCCIIALVISFHYTNKMKYILSDYQSNIAPKIINLNEAKDNYKLALSLIGNSLKSNLKDINNNTIDLKRNDKFQTIFFYFTETRCNSCVLQELNNLSKVSKDVYNITILVRYSDPKKLDYLLKDFKIPNLKYYSLPIDDEIFDSTDLAYLPLTLVFNLSNDQKVINPLVASSTDPDISKAYYKIKDLKYETLTILKLVCI